MNGIENKVLQKIEDNIPWILIILITLIGFFVRFQLRTIVSGDAYMCLMPWYDQIAENGLYEMVGDYGLLYQFMIWIMTRFTWIPSLFAIKIFSCLFDFVMAIGAAFIVHEVAEKDKQWSSVLVYAVIVLCPTVFINSSAWGQCDAVFSAFAVLGIYCLEKEKYNWALIALGMSFSFKLHAVFILPIFLFYYFARRRFSILRFLIVPATMVVTSLPLLFWGRSPFETFGIYAKQTSTWQSIANKYPSVWLLMFKSGNQDQYDYMAPITILITVCVLAAFMVTWLRRKYAVTGINLVIMAFLLTYSCVFFLPAMHERYSFLYEILAIILAVMIPKTMPLTALLIIISCCTYADYLFGTAADFNLLMWLNIFVYLAYILVLGRELKVRNEESVL